MRRSLALLVPLVVLVACGDDDAASDDTTSTSTPSSTSTVVEAPAEEAPAEEVPGGDAGSGEGLGDAVLAGDLDGGGVVPGPGDPAGTGRVEAEVVEGTLCVDMEVTDLEGEITEAHLHSGRDAEDGPVLVDIGLPSSTDDPGTWVDVCAGVDDDVIEDLAAAPELAYVDVHSASFPDGAVRGQLGVISIFDRTMD